MQQENSFFKSYHNIYLVIILITMFTTLPWIGMGDYYTKGEPREASVAVSMLDDQNWILPRVYADEVAYKPPFTHWMIALCSLPGGEVTPFTSRLPSAIAFIVMIGCCFGFFIRFMKKHEAIMAALILISCFELHRSAMTSRVDMVLTAFMVGGLISLFHWARDRQLKGLPWYIPVLLGCAALVKGPVGIILPLLVLGVYLLIVGENFIRIVLKCLLVTVISFIPLFIWYYLAYQQAGDYLIDLVWAENFGRFLDIENLEIPYELGHEHPFWYNFKLLISGFIPWTLFLLLSLFAINYTFRLPKKLRAKVSSMEREKLFCLLAACIIIIFYCIPASKRGVYLMPAYPFIAVFMGQYIYSIALNRSWVNRVFAVVLGVLAGVMICLSVLTLSGIINLQDIVVHFTQRDKTLFHTTLINNALSTPTLLYMIILLCFVCSVGILIYQFRKNNERAILYAATGVWFMCTVLLDGVALPALKDGTSIKPFTDEIKAKYDLKEGNMYVMNNLQRYSNLYGTNFYLHNKFMNFEKVQPEQGFFFTTSTDITEVIQAYPAYSFELLEESPNKFNDTREIVQMYRFNK